MLVDRVFGTIEAEDVLAGDQSTVDQDRQITLFARVNSRVGYFLRGEIYLCRGKVL